MTAFDADLFANRLRIALASAMGGDDYATVRGYTVWARRHGINPNSLRNWLTMGVLPTADSLHALCAELGVSAGWLIGLED